MQLQAAIIHFQELEIHYLSSKKELTKRIVEPFAIYSTNGNFLLIAFCKLRNDFRVFRIDFIQHISKTNQQFTPHNMTMQQFFETYIKK